MELIDPDHQEHREIFVAIGIFADLPRKCIPTMTARRNLAELTLTLGEALEAIVQHLRQRKPIYRLLQESTQKYAYVLLPCRVGTHDLYLKVQLSDNKDFFWLISAHKPKFPYKTPKPVRKVPDQDNQASPVRKGELK